MAASEEKAPDWWKQAALGRIDHYIALDVPFNADEVNHDFDRAGIKTPTAWQLAMGPMFAVRARAGKIVKTGEFRQTDRPGGNARSYPLWRRV
jgi:hypothetical protein